MSRFVAFALVVLGGVAQAPPARAQFVDGDVYVSDFNGAIRRVDPSTWSVTTFANGSNGLSYPSATLLTPAGTLLCSNWSSDQVLELDSAANSTVLYDTSSGLVGPWGENGLAYDGAGNLYVSDYSAQKILLFPAGGGSPTTFADVADGINEPDGLAFTASGDLLVANRYSYSVLTIDPAGVATVWDQMPDDPYSIAIRANGDVYVATVNGESIYRYPGGDPTQRTLLVSFPNNAGLPCLQLSNDGATVYFSSTQTGNLITVDADTGASNEVVAAGTLGGADAITVIGAHHTASWSNYGAGVAGTHGVPAFTSSADPVLGTSVDLSLANSYGQPTSGLILVGLSQANLHTGLGGDVLLIPAFLVPITFSYGSDTFTFAVPNDPALNQFEVDVQAVETDPGAVKGFSFTQGLELVLGY